MLNTVAISLVINRMTKMQECQYCDHKCSYNENDYNNGMLNTVARHVVIMRMTTTLDTMAICVVIMSITTLTECWILWP